MELEGSAKRDCLMIESPRDFSSKCFIRIIWGNIEDLLKDLAVNKGALFPGLNRRERGSPLKGKSASQISDEAGLVIAGQRSRPLRD